MKKQIKSSAYIVGSLVIILVIFPACLKKPFSSHDGGPPAVILLAQAQFINQEGENGEVHSVPGPAKLSIVHQGSNGWETTLLEDPKSNVFHKALWFTPKDGQAGILTIAGNQAALKLWHRVGAKWEPTSLWSPDFGGEHNRLRDIEIGDVTGDGNQDLVIATHDQGIVAVLQWTEAQWKVTEIDRIKDTFVHEIEIGDVNGDGVQEFFATPSAPNRLDGTPQPGKIMMYRFEQGKFHSHTLEEFPKRHVKEILCADTRGKGHPDLFAVIEGEMSMIGGEVNLVDTVKIRQYQWLNGEPVSQIIADLPDMLCRYLTAGDVDGDGTIDLVASTLRSGIWLLRVTADGKWQKSLIDEQSSGFEHATLLADLNHDRKDEIYVASDDQHTLRSYQWDGQAFQKKDLAPLSNDDITFGITCGWFYL